MNISRNLSSRNLSPKTKLSVLELTLAFLLELALPLLCYVPFFIVPLGGTSTYSPSMRVSKFAGNELTIVATSYNPPENGRPRRTKSGGARSYSGRFCPISQPIGKLDQSKERIVYRRV